MAVRACIAIYTVIIGRLGKSAAAAIFVLFFFIKRQPG